MNAAGAEAVDLAGLVNELLVAVHERRRSDAPAGGCLLDVCASSLQGMSRQQGARSRQGRTMDGLGQATKVRIKIYSYLSLGNLLSEKNSQFSE